MALNSETVKQIKIPFDQRPYEWETDQVERLFDDLVNAAPDIDHVHLINQIFLLYADGYFQVYDGQQRTVTMAMMISALLRVFRENTLGTDADNKVLPEPSRSEMSDTQREDLKWIENAFTEYFEKYDRYSNNESSRKYTFDKVETTNYFYELVNPLNDIESIGDGPNNDTLVMHENYLTLLDAWRNYDVANNHLGFTLNRIMESVVVERSITKQRNIAQQKFETLNNTGMTLKDIHVLKNDLASQLNEEMRDDWYFIERTIGPRAGGDFLDKLVTIITGKSAGKNALDKFKKVFPINNKDEARAALAVLKNHAKAYLNTVKPETTDGLLDYVEEATITGGPFSIKQHLPLIMAMFGQNYSSDDIVQVLRAVQSLWIKNVFIGPDGPNTITPTVIELAHQVYESQINASKIVAALSAKEISDKEFYEQLINKSFKKQKLQNVAKIIFMRLANQDLEDTENKVPYDMTRLHYEHILPQAPDKDSNWLKDFPDADERTKYTYALGNGTLLRDKLNKSIINHDFEIKKHGTESIEGYDKSKIPDTLTLLDAQQWTAVEINARTVDMANKIVKYYSHS